LVAEPALRLQYCVWARGRLEYGRRPFGVLRCWGVVGLAAAIGGLLLPGVARAEAVIEQSRQIGPWVLSAISEGETSVHACDLRRAFEDGYALGFWYDEFGGWRLTLAKLDKTWRLKLHDRYPLGYRIDDRPAVLAAGEADTTYAVGVALGKEFEAVMPFKQGRHITIVAAKATFEFDLVDSGRALDALRECAVSYAGYREAHAGDPFSADPQPSTPDPSVTASSNPFTDGSAQPSAEPTGSAVDARVDRMLGKFEATRLIQAMFRYRPALRNKVRDRLIELARMTSPEELERTWSLEASRVVAPEVEALMVDAPPDVLYPLIKEQLGVLLEFQQSNPQYCVDYFVGSGTVPGAAFPRGAEQRELELKADVVEGAINRPDPVQRPVDQDALIRLIRKAYAKQGYPLSEFAQLARQKSLSASDGCRVAVEFSTALTGLDPSEAASIYKAMAVMGAEQGL
jgi:hypothetical protein